MRSIKFFDFVRAFVTDFRKTWFEAMSGGISIPFAAIGVILALNAKDSDSALIAALVFLTLAFFGAWYAAFAIWKIQKERADKFAEKLTPKFKVTFDEDKRGTSVEVDTWKEFHQMSAYGTPTERELCQRAKYFRICIQALTNAVVDGCEAYITRLEKRKDAGEQFSDIQVTKPIPLRSEAFSVKPRIPEYVDFLKVGENNTVVPITVTWPNSLDGALNPPAIYRITFRVHGAGVTADPVIVDVVWRGEWNVVYAYQVL